MPSLSETPLAEIDPAEAWEPWAPGPDDPWGPKWAGHLCRRAAFGATRAELLGAIANGPEATIDGLLAGGEGQAEFDQLMDALAPDVPLNEGFPQQDPDPGGLQGWWLYRMTYSLHPLRERMTLFWHDHFATSIAKVRQPAAMLAQNHTIRAHALGKFRPLLLEMARDPAMLIWLDSNSNVRGRPNENFAREVMELFTLGVGHYTEKDVREAARAFTGWHTDGKAFTLARSQHDDGPKALLGQSGKWDGADVVRILLEQPSAALFLTRKLYRAFIGEAESPPDRLLEPLARRLRESDYDVADLMGTMLRSRLLFSGHAFRQRVKSPVEYVVGLLRAVEAKVQGEAAALPLPGLMDGLGQALFAPPNVKGWPGGEAWLNSATLLARHNLAWRIIQGARGPVGIKVNPLALARKHGVTREPAALVGFFLDLLLQEQGDGRAAQRLSEFLSEGEPEGADLEVRLREAVHAIILMPDYQLA